MNASTKRFSGRVENYVRYRPGYPLAVLEFLKSECGLSTDDIVADVGSGTGIFTGMLLQNGNAVIAVEPNREMREAAEHLLADCPSLRSVDGTGEATSLPSGSVDLVTVAQAFHWFDPVKAREEFVRILRPKGWVAVIWNVRRDDTSAFAKDYEGLLRTYGTDYGAVVEKHGDVEAMKAFFGGEFKSATFRNAQRFDCEGLAGRLNSSSFVPGAEDPKYPQMMADLRELFGRHAVDGCVTVDYDTPVFAGQLD